MFKAAILEMVVFRHFPPKIWRDMGAHFQEHHLSYLKPSRNKSSMKMVTESWKMTQLYYVIINDFKNLVVFDHKQSWRPPTDNGEVL